MLLDKIKYENNRPYTKRLFNCRGHKYIGKSYGHIVKCHLCNKDCFVSDAVFKRQQIYFCGRKCGNAIRPNFLGRKKCSGYVAILNHDHPNNNRGYVFEHRLIIEKQIGRYLHRYEVVHHINKIRDDNRAENLMVFNGNHAHRKFEMIQEGIKDGDIIFDGRSLSQIKS